MTEYTNEMLDKAVEDGKAGTCICVDGTRIIVPTACSEIVSFTNPDDLEPAMRDRWKAGERGPEFENQKLKPGDCLVMKGDGNFLNRILDKDPDWYKTAEGIKNMIENLYEYVEPGATLNAPAIWNSDLTWAKNVHFITSANEEVNEKMWQERCGHVIEGLKQPKEQLFIHLSPGDVLITPVLDENGNQKIDENGNKLERRQTAGGFAAVAVKQPGDRSDWNIVQLGAKGYIVVKEKINQVNHSKKKEAIDWLQKKKEALEVRLKDKVGKTVKQENETEKEFADRVKKQIAISRAIMKQKRERNN